MRMKKNNLIVVAGVVWLVAGANVAVLGARAATGMSGIALAVAVALVVGAVATFLAFHTMFSRLVVKNSRRIRSLKGARHNPLRFFDARSYAIMAVMMSLGIGMRAAGIFPDWFVAFFYTGLGLALALAGASYIIRGVRGRTWVFNGSK